ncbi:tryptophan dimethylallyltransferase family protein [Streptomyces sp. ZYX-F-203]
MTLGDHTGGQLRRLCEVAGLSAADAGSYARLLVDVLGPVADRPLTVPPPNRTFLSDDHTPVEFSLSFRPGADPTVRVLVEPGCGTDRLLEAGRVGLAQVRAMARRWGFSTASLDEVGDLFLPDTPQGALALWCALELPPGGVPRVKVYLDPAASGAEHSGATLREAHRRLGHLRAFESLPEADGYPFFALDLGEWSEPRAKVYLRHEGLTAGRVGSLVRCAGGGEERAMVEFFRAASGIEESDAGLTGRPGLSCHAFTDAGSARPSGFTLHVPVRDYAPHDAEALARAEGVLRDQGIDGDPLARALGALTPRRPEDGVGLIAYLALAHQRGRTPRVTAYVSSEAYAVTPPTDRASLAAAAG